MPQNYAVMEMIYKITVEVLPVDMLLTYQAGAVCLPELIAEQEKLAGFLQLTAKKHFSCALGNMLCRITIEVVCKGMGCCSNEEMYGCEEQLHYHNLSSGFFSRLC